MPFIESAIIIEDIVQLLDTVIVVHNIVIARIVTNLRIIIVVSTLVELHIIIVNYILHMPDFMFEVGFVKCLHRI